MSKLPCGRTEMCSPCESVEHESREIICRTVQHIGGISGFSSLDKIGHTSLMHFVADEMEGVLTIEQDVTGKLIDSTIESLRELTELSKKG